MDIRDGFVGSVGDTPLIGLRRISEETGCEILGKAEFMNPGGSVKDRAALGIIEAAERDGRLQPGGTLAGVGRALKAHRPEVQVVLADPHGSGLFEWVAHGEIKVEGSSITEGIGNGRVTANLEGTSIDDAVRIGDLDAVAMVYRMLREEGLYLGGSSGINVCAAVEVARRLGPGHTIVTILCDGGDRYRSRLFNDEWLETKGLAESVS